MKKRAIMISMLLVMALSVTGCSQKTATKDKDTKTEEKVSVKGELNNIKKIIILLQ
mgnify:CR=1 FL=1